MNSDGNVIRDLVFTALQVPGVEGMCWLEAHTHVLPSATGVTYLSGMVQAPEYMIVLAQMRRQILEQAARELEGGS